jgi:phosphohistidine phosphatase SixA
MSLKNLNIFFVRHGNAAPAAEGQHDHYRQLTEKGDLQARMLAENIGHDFDVVIASPTARTQRTAMFVRGNPEEGIYTLDSLVTLPDPEGKAILERMYAELGHAPVTAYTQHADAGTLIRFAKNAAKEITEILMRKCVTHTDVLIVGHGVLTNAIIGEMFPTSEVQMLMLQTQLGECGCIRVQVDGNGFASAEVFN